MDQSVTEERDLNTLHGCQPKTILLNAVDSKGGQDSICCIVIRSQAGLSGDEILAGGRVFFCLLQNIVTGSGLIQHYLQ